MPVRHPIKPAVMSRKLAEILGAIPLGAIPDDIRPSEILAFNRRVVAMIQARQSIPVLAYGGVVLTWEVMES